MHHFLSMSALAGMFAAADIAETLFSRMQGGVGCGKVCVARDAQGVRAPVLGSTEKLSLLVCPWARVVRRALGCIC